MRKRIFDLVVVAASAPLWGPILAVLWVIVRVRLGTPAFFRQQRPGIHGKPFVIWKFRTMTSQRGSDGQLLPDEARLTPFGAWLRSTSLDELPEIINVLRGEMSLVGPRPLLMQYLERYSPRQARRHEVKPGITGWAQINGRNAVSWEEKFELDVWYVDHHSLWLDIRILARTLVKVLSRADITAPGHATAPEFMGSTNEAEPDAAPGLREKQKPDQ